MGISEWSTPTSGAISLQHGIVKYAVSAVSANGDAPPTNAGDGSIDVENTTIEHGTDGISTDYINHVVVKHDTLTNLQSGIIVSTSTGQYLTPPPVIEGNSTNAVGTGLIPGPGDYPAYFVAGPIDAALLGGNHATGGFPYFQIGQVAVVVSSTLPRGGPTWILDGQLTVP